MEAATAAAVVDPGEILVEAEPAAAALRGRRGSRAVEDGSEVALRFRDLDAPENAADGMAFCGSSCSGSGSDAPENAADGVAFCGSSCSGSGSLSESTMGTCCDMTLEILQWAREAVTGGQRAGGRGRARHRGWREDLHLKR